MTGARTRTLAWIAGAAGLVALPYLVAPMRVHLATEVFVFALFGVGFNLVFGYAGQLPFGHAALFGIGGYTTALLLKSFPAMPLPFVLLAAGILGFVAALVIGAFCVRLSGAYFALTSLAFQMFLYAIALKWRSVTGGDDGMSVTRPDLRLPGVVLSLQSVEALYYVTLVVVATGIAACYVFLKTPLGNAVVCVREREDRAAFLGYDVFLVKLTAFSLSGVLVGVAGALFVLFQEFVATTTIDSNMSMVPVLMTVIGGPGRFFGPIMGAAFYLLFQDWLSSLTTYWMLIMGAVFVVMVLYVDGGLIGAATRLRAGRRLVTEP
jgi:branched-chain amino acid transport system permease protein